MNCVDFIGSYSRFWVSACLESSIKHLLIIHAIEKRKKQKQPSLSGYRCSESRRGVFVLMPFCIAAIEDVGHCRYSSHGNEAVHALDHCAVALHVVADVVVIADVTKDDL